jgi:methionyl-tRNA formyltransferase
MKILYVTNKNFKDLSIPNLIRKKKDKVLIKKSRFNLNFLIKNKIDFIICDKSRFLINDKILKIYKNRVINIHASYLPYAKGYQPIFFSLIFDYPLGFSFIYCNKYPDCGEIIYKKKVKINAKDSLKIIHSKIRKEIYKTLQKKYFYIFNSFKRKFKKQKHDFYFSRLTSEVFMDLINSDLDKNKSEIMIDCYDEYLKLKKKIKKFSKNSLVPIKI